MIPPTPAQKQALDAIRRLSARGVAPSFAELGHALGLASKSGVHRLVHGLKARGWVDFEPNGVRTLRILEGAERIDLSTMSGVELVQLRDRITAELVNRG